jgi:hypothetical protein
MGKRRDIIVRDRLPFDAEPPGSVLDGRGIGRVDVSLDEGRSWRQADLHPVISQWAWRLWSLTVEAHPGPITVTRAWDDTGVTQPESPAPLWNPRGVRQQRLGPRESVREIGDPAQARRCLRVVLNCGTSRPVTIPLRDAGRWTLWRDAADNVVSEV